MENLSIEQRDNILIVRFTKTGVLHSGNAEDFKSAVAARYQPGMHMVIDLSNLDFIDSAGLTALIYLRRKVTEKKAFLKLTGVGARIDKLLKITRLHRVFDQEEDLETAIQNLHKTNNRPLPVNTYQITLKKRKIGKILWTKIQAPDSLIEANAQQFRKIIEQLLTECEVLILNFDEIRNIDSAGIASLIHLKKLSKHFKKKIILVYSNRVLTKLFKLYSIDDLFSQFQTDQEALLAVNLTLSNLRKKSPKAPEPKLVQEPAPQFSDIMFLSANR